MPSRMKNTVASFCVLLVALFVPAGFATGQSSLPTFEVATIKAAPNASPEDGSWSRPGIGSFTATHVSLTRLLQLAYGVDSSQIVKKPAWLDTDLFDVVAKPEKGIRLTREELRPRLQNLLKERFSLEAHSETGLSNGLALIVGKDGPHLSVTKGDHFPGFRVNVSPGQMRGFNWNMQTFAMYLTDAAGFPVIDETGLSGSYDIDFSYAAPNESDSNSPSLDIALKQATGLVLKSKKIQVETVVIDSIQRLPTAN